MDAIGGLLWLFGLVLGIAVLFAQFRLFSIDNTLKQILAELREARKLQSTFSGKS